MRQKDKDKDRYGDCLMKLDNVQPGRVELRPKYWELMLTSLAYQSRWKILVIMLALEKNLTASLKPYHELFST